MALDHLVSNDGRDVLGRLKATIVLEQYEFVLLDRGVGGEQERDVDRPGSERRHRERTARVERDESVELETVRALQPVETQRTFGALGRATEREVLVDRRQVADRLQAM